MGRDPLVQEIRAIREAYAEQYHYDLQAIHDDLKELERRSGRQVVSPPKRRSGTNRPVATKRGGA
jgi:hypothetical protein